MINGEVRCHPARSGELRDQTDIRQCHFRTSKKSCGTSHRLKSCKPRLDPVTCPCIDGFLVQPDLLPKMFEHPQIVDWMRSEEHTSELQSLMRISYAVFCLKK